LLTDSEQAYDQLAELLRPYDITPLFRNDGGQHAVLLVPGIVRPQPSNPWVNLVLFVLTLLSVIFAGALYNYSGPVSSDPREMFMLLLRSLPTGVPFAISMLAILLAHEFGHYLAGRYHHTSVTLPYFIPFPISPFGTMGAFIRLKEPPKNKRVLLDIGIAGPIAGLVVAIPVLLYGLSLSRVGAITVEPGAGFQLEGNSLLYLLAKYAVFGQLLPAPASYGNVPQLLYWVRYFFTSQPLPIGGTDVLIHPIAWAGWAGLLVTALNLIPAGQLDGGHVMYVLIGRRAARRLWPFILVLLGLLGFVWSGWWIWAVLILLLGRLYAEPLDQVTRLDPPRRAVAMIGVILFFLVFTPVPLVQAIYGAV
jgi:membrane-associated protease RseP (regulator of RpoE activity)